MKIDDCVIFIIEGFWGFGVSFSSGKEIIKLNQESFDRALYSAGALTAAKWLMKKKAGLYSMRDLLNFKWTVRKKLK